MANNFSLLLTLVTLITGIIWVIYRVKLILARKKIAQQHQVTEENQHPNIGYKNSWMKSYASMFPILALVLVIRSFLYEPFTIPSCSMMPNLLVGDFILVEKFAYGLKDPVTQTTFFTTGQPKRGDIVVFKYPKNTTLNFVKRVIGLPGDKIIYYPKQKKIRIYENFATSDCAKVLPIVYSSLKYSEWTLLLNNMLDNQKGSYSIPLDKPIPMNALRQAETNETLGHVSHDIMLIPQVYTQSSYQQPGLPNNEWIVPPKHYFMMGDNRDNSDDSRMWGFVPEDNLVGRAVIIWFSLDKHEGEWPTGVRFSRIRVIH